MIEEPRKFTFAWIKWRWKISLRAMVWTVRTHPWASAFGFGIGTADRLGFIEPAGWGSAVFLGCFVMWMAVTLRAEEEMPWVGE